MGSDRPSHFWLIFSLFQIFWYLKSVLFSHLLQVDCFKCAQCSRPFPDCKFNMVNELPYCNSCVVRYKKCLGCHRRITELQDELEEMKIVKVKTTHTQKRHLGLFSAVFWCWFQLILSGGQSRQENITFVETSFGFWHDDCFDEFQGTQKYQHSHKRNSITINSKGVSKVLASFMHRVKRWGHALVSAAKTISTSFQRQKYFF